MADKLPSFQFYPGDWLKDANLRRCSPQARGVWIDMICLSFDCAKRGRFETNGKAWSVEQIARAVGGVPSETEAAINELIDAEVAKVDEIGVIYSKRVVEDERLRQIRKQAGSKGGSKRQANRKQSPSKPPSKLQANTLAKSGSSSSSSELGKKKGNTRSVCSRSDAERIYDLYPTKRDREAAINAIVKAVGRLKKSGHDDPLGYLEQAVSAWAGSRFVATAPKQMIKYPATWFNAGSYDDDRSEWDREYDAGNSSNGRPAPKSEPPAGKPSVPEYIAKAARIRRELESAGVEVTKRMSWIIGTYTDECESALSRAGPVDGQDAAVEILERVANQDGKAAR